MVMRRRPVGRERPGERLPPDLRTVGRLVRTGRSALAVSAVLAAMGSGVVLPAVASADPPPGRAYERVSPAEKPSGASGLSTRTGGLAMPGRSADVGERLVYGLSAGVFDSWSGGPNPLIFGERTPTGWHGRTAIRSTDYGNTPLEISAHEPRSAWMTDDGRELAFGTARPLGWRTTSPIPQIYRATDDDAPPTWISEPADGIAPVNGVQQITLSAGGDAQTLAFASTARLTPDAPAAGSSAVYVRRGAGGLQIASRLPGGSVAAQGRPANSTSTMTGSAPAARTQRNEVAGKGRFVLFVTGGSTTEAPLFVRDLDENKTRQLAGGGGQQPDSAVSLNRAANNPGIATAPLGLVFGARDGARAYFLGQIGSGATSTRGMYEANLATGSVTSRPAIDGVPLQVTADGQRMLFLTPATAGVRQLRYWDAESPTASVLVGEIDAASPPAGFAQVFEPSADGRTWTFLAAGSLDLARPNVAPNTRQLYRWTLGSEAPTCLSCRPVDGVARYAGANLTVQESGPSESLLSPTGTSQPGDDLTMLAQPGHGPSDDGRWLLFDSPDRLVQEDTNEVRDVYLWDRDGAPGKQLQLVTSGQGSVPSWALDLSPDGVNAFFLTRDALVPGDGDGAYDVYTARIGGGFPGSPESCVGEECRPSVKQATAVAGTLTDVLAPVSVGAQIRLKSSSKSAATLRVRKGKVTSKWVTLRVRTPGAGKVRVRGKGLRTATRTVKRSATYTVKVSLTKQSRRALARKGRLRLRVSVRFTPKQGKATRKTVSWTIKRSSRSSRKGR